MIVREEVERLHSVAPLVAATTNEMRCNALRRVAEKLEEKKEEIFAENKKDLDAATENNVPDAIVKRLKFNEAKLRDVVAGIDQLISLPDPLGKITLDRELDSDLRLTRFTSPIVSRSMDESACSV